MASSADHKNMPFSGLVALSRVAAAGLLVLACLAAAPAAIAQTATLKSAAAAKGRYFGAALDPAYLAVPTYRDLAIRQLSSITPENAMKWAVVEPSRGNFNWSGADRLVALARTNQMRVRGHNLVWHSQLPSWLTHGGFSAAELKTIMVDHIGAEAARYKGAIYAWDVVNEPFDDNGGWRDSLWRQAMGASYIATALDAARAADPAAKLYINEYNVETAGPKFAALYDLAASLKHSGAPIDGVGLQAHFVAGHVPSDLQAVIAKFAALGVDVAITELDIRIPLPASAEKLAQQASDYGAVVGACLAVARCVGITTWGMTDGHSWIPSFFPGYGAALLFDEDNKPKPAYAAAIRALAR
jgi:endo-1,4-beta-xylanase